METVIVLLVLFLIVRNFMKDKSDGRDPIGRPRPNLPPSPRRPDDEFTQEP